MKILLTVVLRAIISISLLALSQMSLGQALKPNADPSILFVNGSHSNKAKLTLLKELAVDHGIKIERKTQRDIKGLSEAALIFAQYDLVVLEGVSVRDSKKLFSQYSPVVAKANNKILAINWLQADQLRKGLSVEQAKRLQQYFGNGGTENLKRMLDYLTHRILKNNMSYLVKSPIIYPQVGIYHPDYEGLVFSSRDEYLAWRGIPLDLSTTKTKPVVGVLLQRALIESVQTTVVDATIAQLEAKGVTVIPFFFELSPRSSEYSGLLVQEGQKDSKTVVDLIVNFRAIHWANKRKQEFEKLGVPVMQALTYYDGDQRHWEANSQGISPGMTPFVLTLPEAAGVIDPVIVAAVNDKTGSSEIIDYQLEHLVNKAIKLASLKYTANSDKRLTVMVWGDRDVGASFLNIPESLKQISARLNKEGYGINAVESNYFSDKVDRILSPFYRNFELDELLDDDLAELMPVADYLSWFNTLPESVRKPINDYWGHPKNNFMVVMRDGKSQFVLPRIRNGNMLVMRQPPRADDKDEDKRLFHKGEVPMNHFYLAAYYYARQYWKSDALIHLGTHGSQEYLSGKERGLSRYDQSNLAVWDTPVFYPFIVDDVGEAMQTKRRGSATVLAHMTPPFAAAGLQGDMASIHELMHQYKSLDEGGVKEKTGQQIVDDCIEADICADFGWELAQINADFPGFLDALHDYMMEVSVENQPLGLHTYGELPERPLLISTLVQMLGKDFAQHAAEFEDYYFIDDNSAHHSANHDKKHPQDDFSHDGDEGLHSGAGEELEDIVGYKTVEKFILGVEENDLFELDEDFKALVIKGREMYQHFAGIKELEHLIDGLEGRYIPVKNGGDPIRHPDAVPTGFNLYGFDPSRVPTKAAFEQGKELTEGVIADYYNKHGKYPDKLAFSLWSIETMRHYGVLESQALYAMGVRPTWSDDGRVIGSEIIPAAELKRPRVDVVLSATGLYRDAFPNVMQRLANAIEQVALLKEESNFVWRNSQRVKSELMADGIAEEEAEYLSTVRLFSNSSGNYGSGVDGPVFASDTWETDAKIADNYLSKMGFYYGPEKKGPQRSGPGRNGAETNDENRWGQQLENVNLYAKQLSGTDVAMFSRSSNVYGMISSDDPFEYFGSLALAVRNLDGASPEMLISNLRDANNAKAENAAEFLSRELRTRNFHKRWVEEMMKEGYSGAVSLSSHLDNFWGWQVVDPNLVRDDQWQEFYEVYVEDKLELNIQEWFEQVNPESQANMLARMLEANRKEYWQADAEVLKAIVERYVELVEKYDMFVDNEKLREYVNQQAGGFGLAALPAPEVSSALNANTAQAEAVQVEGQKLEKVEQQPAVEDDWDLRFISLLLFCLLTIIAGAWRQHSKSLSSLPSRERPEVSAKAA